VPLCPPQTPHAASTRTRAAAVGSQRLTAELRHGPNVTLDPCCWIPGFQLHYIFTQLYFQVLLLRIFVSLHFVWKQVIVMSISMLCFTCSVPNSHWMMKHVALLPNLNYLFPCCTPYDIYRTSECRLFLRINHANYATQYNITTVLGHLTYASALSFIDGWAPRLCWTW
jgi:hypothetical protein